MSDTPQMCLANGSLAIHLCVPGSKSVCKGCSLYKEPIPERPGLGVVTRPEGVYAALRRDEASRGNTIKGDIHITRANYAYYDIVPDGPIAVTSKFPMNRLLLSQGEVVAALKALNFILGLHEELYRNDEELADAQSVQALLRSLLVTTKEEP